MKRTMKYMIAVLFAGVAVAIFSMGYTEGKNRSDLEKDIANGYFRVGQQAALVACELHPNSRPLIVDDPEIWDALRKLNSGSVLGLNTNRWSTWPDPRWTVLNGVR